MSNNNIPSSKQMQANKKHSQHIEKATRRRQLKSAQKNFRRNQQPKPARRKNWTPAYDDDWDDQDYNDQERVMPRGEQARRRSIEKTAFRPAKTDKTQDAAPEIAGLRGLVVEVRKGLCQVDLGEEILPCHIRGTLQAQETGYTNIVAVGDEVLISLDGTGGGVVESVLPRRSILARPDVFSSHLQQVLVANADQLLIVLAWRQPTIWLELLDRYLIAAERNNLPVVICINKSDLVKDQTELQNTLQPYRDLGYDIILTSALTSAGLNELHSQLQQRITVLSGLSGVGKSTLLNKVQPDLQLRVGAVSDYHSEGKHTTTQASLIRLNDDTAVIDTPGIREFGLSGLDQQDLAQYFPEMAALATTCRFANCTHLTEPDCTVQTAVSSGDIAASRYHSYKQIYNSL